MCFEDGCTISTSRENTSVEGDDLPTILKSGLWRRASNDIFFVVVNVCVNRSLFTLL